jgi:hypothetical protein
MVVEKKTAIVKVIIHAIADRKGIRFVKVVFEREIAATKMVFEGY